jgi:mannonate dehydratase
MAQTQDVMRIAIGQFNELSDERLRFAKQLGVSGVLLNTPRLPGEHRWEYDDLARLREHVESYGLRLEALENTPVSFYLKAILGLPGRDEQLEYYQNTIRAMGRAGIPVLAYNWRPNRLYRTARVPGRGGALVTAFDAEEAKAQPLSHGRVYAADEMWQTYEYFVRRVIPVAEEAGVRVALHPDDPPIPDPLGGAARIVTSIENYDRIYNLAPSPVNAMLFCQGCVAEMGEDIYSAIAYASSAGRIVYVHFRDIVGTPYNFQEVFIDEGQNDMVRAMETYRDNGFYGPFMMDHTPRMPEGMNDLHGHAYANGYIRALIRAVYR